MVTDDFSPIDLASIAKAVPLTGGRKGWRTRQGREAAAERVARKRAAATARARRRRGNKPRRLSVSPAALEARAAQRRAAWAPSHGGDGSLYPRPAWLCLVAAARPGQWHTARELAELTGMTARRVGTELTAPGAGARRRGLFERGEFADSVTRAPERARGMYGQKVYRPLAPRFVWRLSTAGLEARRLALALE